MKQSEALFLLGLLGLALATASRRKRGTVMAKRPPEEKIPHPTRETRSLFPDDDFLRARGWQIVERHRQEEPVWSLAGFYANQGEALALERQS